MMMASIFEVMNILEQHTDKNFVQRIAMAEGYPKLYDSINSYVDGPSTHSMAWGEDDRGNAYVYPTVVQPGRDKPLRRLSPSDAWKYAQQTGEFIPFGKNKEMADQFSRDYKKVWGNGTKK
jgi:hypothetical protein